MAGVKAGAPHAGLLPPIPTFPHQGGRRKMPLLQIEYRTVLGEGKVRDQANHWGVALFRRRSLDDLQVRSPPGTLCVVRLRGWAET